MLIDPYQAGWLAQLLEQYQRLSTGARLVMLIDGAFVPGLFRQLSGSRPVLLFESLPGCSEAVKDVSPFLVEFQPDGQELLRVLEQCDGLPMLSAIVTHESVEIFGQRLAAWCIVEIEGERFNFRFPDTRRLPAIFDTLTRQQQRSFVGNVASWRYIDRDGSWTDLRLDECGDGTAATTSKAELNRVQFARLVGDSEADEIWARLQYRGVVWEGLPSRLHHVLITALELSRQHGLDDISTLRWCSSVVNDTGVDGGVSVAEAFWRWKKASTESHVEEFQDIA